MGRPNPQRFSSVPSPHIDSRVKTVPAKGGQKGNENGTEATQANWPTVRIGLVVAPKPGEGGWPSDIPHVCVFRGALPIETGSISGKFD